MLSVGNRIKTIRSELRKTQLEFGLLAGGVSDGTVSNWELGRITPRIDQLTSLEESTGARMMWITTGEGERFDKSKAKPRFTENQQKFIALFGETQFDIHTTAIEKGWWEEDRGDGEMIALCHSELSELLEGLRHGNPADDKIPEYSAAEAEAADVVIRLMDMAAKRGWRLGEAIIAKSEINKTRDYRHGGKLF